MGSYLQENDERVNFEVREVQKVDSDLRMYHGASFDSEASKSPLKMAERSEEYGTCSAFVFLKMEACITALILP